MYSFSYSCILFRWDSPYHKILQDITGLPAQPFQQFNTGARSTAQRQAERETGTGNGKRERETGNTQVSRRSVTPQATREMTRLRLMGVSGKI